MICITDQQNGAISFLLGKSRHLCNSVQIKHFRTSSTQAVYLNFAIGLFTTFTSGCKSQIEAAYPKHLKLTFQDYYCFQENYAKL